MIAQITAEASGIPRCGMVGKARRGYGGTTSSSGVLYFELRLSARR